MPLAADKCILERDRVLDLLDEIISQLPAEIKQSRTIVELLGSIQADGYGAFSSDFACQFLPAQKLVTDGVPVENIDSLHLVLAYPNGAYVGDSIAPMGLQVYQIKSKLESPIYSNSNPLDYYDPQSQPIASKIYVGNAQGESDSIQALSYREIAVKLPLSATAAKQAQPS